jgi:Family of unknown function (DUF6152)
VKRRIVSLAIGIASASMVVQAHHSIAAVYDTSRQVTVKGVLTAFRFVNPHPFLMIDVTDAAQKTQPWQLEIDNRWELVAIGVTAETWKAGDWIVVTGFPGRTQPHSLYVRTLDRPADGFRYEQVGGSPRIHPPPVAMTSGNGRNVRFARTVRAPTRVLPRTCRPARAARTDRTVPATPDSASPAYNRSPT